MPSTSAKLDAFTGMYNELMLAPSDLSKLEREMIAVVVSAENRCYLLPRRPWPAVRALSGDPALGETLVDELPGGDGHAAPAGDARLRGADDPGQRQIEEADRVALRELDSATATSGTSRRSAGFFNMSNRMASAVDMRPNPEYHAQAR